MSRITPTRERALETYAISSRLPGSNDCELKIQDIMGREPVTATTEDSVFSAAKKMSENSVSCVVVVDDKKVIGILTDKDVLKGVAKHDREFRRLRVAERMSRPVEVVSPESSIIEAGKILETRGIKRLPVVEAGRLVGMVTQTDIARGLIAISPLKAVSDIMTANVTSIDTAATITEAAQLMSAQGISSLIALHRHGVAGIITEKDLLRRVVALHKDPMQVQVVDVMSFPLISIPPSYSILSAAKKMDMMHLRRLVVMTGSQIYGIVTQTDITRSIRTELEQLQQQQRDSTAKLNSLIGVVMQDLKRLEAFLNEPSGLSPRPHWTASAAPTSQDDQATAETEISCLS